MVFLNENLQEEYVFNYAMLNQFALKAASYITQFIKPGERAVLMLPSGPELALCILGCLYAGVVAVPVQPVTSRKESRWKRVRRIVNNCDAHLLLTMHQNIDITKRQLADTVSSLIIEGVSVDILSTFEVRSGILSPKPHCLAVLQYTSGSTGEPKGVKTSHANIIANQKLIRESLGHNNHTIVLSWLPLHHDMGLIAGLLQPLFLGVPLILMSPMTFIRKPLNWLKAMSFYRATTSGAPNFAYDLCVRKIKDDETSGIDLSAWRVAAVGAEPIRSETLDRFAQKFEHCNFHRSSLYPCYGLAEATLFVTGAVPQTGAVTNYFKCELGSGVAEKVCDSALLSNQTTLLVSSGVIKCKSGEQVRIVDPDSKCPVSENCVGEIWIRSPSVCNGYWNDSYLTYTTFQASCAGAPGSYLRTGDLGFINDDQLYVTGRIKDLIIIRGLNHAPHDIEDTVQRCSDIIIKNAGAAFSVEHDNEERLVIVQEVGRNGYDAEHLESLLLRISEAIIVNHDVEPFDIVLVREMSMPKTSSGKIQRNSAREFYLAGTLPVKARKMLIPHSSGKREPEDRLYMTETNVEQVIIHLWAGILKVPFSSLSRSCGLFDSGGDSLKVAQLLTEIRERYDIDVPLEKLYESPTIQTLIELVHPALKKGKNLIADDLEEERF
tara:strand:- start:1575 stop:3566 length:1992 start_codon:yes stop_codon:yes gene_type:complete